MLNYSNALNHAMSTVQIGEVKEVMQIRGLILQVLRSCFQVILSRILKDVLCSRRNGEVLRQITNLPLKFTNPS